MWLAAFIAFVTALILVLVHGFQREDLVPLVVLLCVVVAAYAFRLQQYVRRPSSYCARLSACESRASITRSA
jgi:hypothetical protein